MTDIFKMAVSKTVFLNLDYVSTKNAEIMGYNIAQLI
jgi:hypothetical protein